MRRGPEFFLGKTLPGGYTLTKELGSGTFGTTFEGYLPNSTTPFAVKVFHEAADQLAVAQFAQEAITLAQLKHPNIVPFRRFGVEQVQVNGIQGVKVFEHYPFFVMAFANNGDVRRLKPRNSFTPLPPDQVIELLSQAAQGIQFAHDAETPHVHRDLKPENLLLHQSQTTNYVDVWVADFGVAVAAHSLKSIDLDKQSPAGTPQYMAPEQFKAQAVRESDQYALGVIAFELLTGRRPFEGNRDFWGWAYVHASELPPSFYDSLKKSGLESLMNPKLEAIEPVIRRALSKTPQDRYPRVHDFAQALETNLRLVTEDGRKQEAKKWYEVGLDLQKKGKRLEALQALDRAIGLVPNYRDAFFIKGRTLYLYGIGLVQTHATCSEMTRCGS